MVLLIVSAFLFLPANQATLSLPGANAELIVELRPSHPYLAEYKRSVALVFAKGRKVERLLFPDTGGYLRSQLYALSDGSYLLQGHFDVARIMLAEPQIAVTNEPIPLGAKYLGAFDEDATKQWRFIPATESGVQALYGSKTAPSR